MLVENIERDLGTRISTLVANSPVVSLSTRREKTSFTSSGRPMSRLSAAMVDSKNTLADSDDYFVSGIEALNAHGKVVLTANGPMDLRGKSGGTIDSQPYGGRESPDADGFHTPLSARRMQLL